MSDISLRRSLKRLTLMFSLYSPLTFSWYFFSVDPASLTAMQTYSPLSSGDTDARMRSVPSSRMDTPGSAPVSSSPLRSHLITGFGVPEEKQTQRGGKGKKEGGDGGTGKENKKRVLKLFS